MCRKCFLCGRNGNGDRLERHHIFGASNRKHSEKYGLVVDLCGECCHRNGEFSAHRNAEVAAYLHRYGQEKAMKEQDWTVKQFIEKFGKSYI